VRPSAEEAEVLKVILDEDKMAENGIDPLGIIQNDSS
jgi:hypothetical protein